MSVPIWIYLVFAGIIFSAIMTIKAVKEEEKIDQQYIEKEGDVYLDRIEKEREERKKRRQMAQ
jgi:Na+/glutamate symporter